MAGTSFELLSERATRHAEAGNWDAARNDWLAALGMVPDSAEAMLELSYVESLAGRYRQAHDWCLRAAGAVPRSRATLAGLARRLRTFNAGEPLRRLAAGALADGRTPPELLVECATQLSNLGDFGLACECAQAAVARAPASVVPRFVRGQLHAHHGRVEAAEADFAWGLARAPGNATAWWMLSRLRRQTPESNHVDRLRALLASPGLHPNAAAALARALHKELDDLGEYEAAWRALETMCAAMRSSLRYDPRETRALVDALVAWRPRSGATVASSATGATRATAASPGDGDRTPVFIVGMHRSGTTLLEQLLGASPAVRPLGELYDFTSALRHAIDYQCRIPVDVAAVARMRDADPAGVGRRYLDGMAWRLGAESHFTDKQPANFLNAGFICAALPQARILHMVRDPVETCFSNLRELFADDYRHSYDQRHLADYFLQYRRLMAHWHALFPGRILDVDYARLTTDPEATMREVAAFCGIDYVEGMTSTRARERAVATASAIQVREEVGRRTTAKWVPYAQHLQPLREALRQGGVVE